MQSETKFFEEKKVSPYHRPISICLLLSKTLPKSFWWLCTKIVFQELSLRLDILSVRLLNSATFGLKTPLLKHFSKIDKKYKFQRSQTDFFIWC